MSDAIKKLKEGKRGDKYLCKLALLDHLRECLEKDNYIKATDEPKDSDGYKNLEKELMDLHIILEIYFDEQDKLYKKRINKFLDNLKK